MKWYLIVTDAKVVGGGMLALKLVSIVCVVAAVAAVDYTGCLDVELTDPNPDNLSPGACDVCEGTNGAGYPCDQTDLCYCARLVATTTPPLYQPQPVFTGPFMLCGPRWGTTTVPLSGSPASQAQCQQCDTPIGPGGGYAYWPCDDGGKCECVDLPSFGANIFNNGQCNDVLGSGAAYDTFQSPQVMHETGRLPHIDQAQCQTCLTAGDAKYCDQDSVCACYDVPFVTCATGQVESLSGDPATDALCQACFGDPNNLADECTTLGTCRCVQDPNLFESCPNGVEPGENVSPTSSIYATVQDWCNICATGTYPDAALHGVCTTNDFCRCAPGPNIFYGGGCASGAIEPTGLDPAVEQGDCDVCLLDSGAHPQCDTTDECQCVASLPNVYDGCPQVLPVTATEGDCAACVGLGPQTGTATATACSTVGACQCVRSIFFHNVTCLAGVEFVPDGPYGAMAFDGLAPDGDSLCAECLAAEPTIDASLFCQDTATCTCRDLVNRYVLCPWPPVNASADVDPAACKTCWPSTVDDFHPVCNNASACVCGKPPPRPGAHRCVAEGRHVEDNRPAHVIRRSALGAAVERVYQLGCSVFNWSGNTHGQPVNPVRRAPLIVD